MIQALQVLALLAAGFGTYIYGSVHGDIKRSEALQKIEFTGHHEIGEGPALSLYVAGDSVAAGVGASDWQDTVAGRLAARLGTHYRVNVRNVSESGAEMKDMAEQPVPSPDADLTLLIIGSNDLLHWTWLRNFRQFTEATLQRFSAHSGVLVLMAPGDIAEAPALPGLVRPLYNRRRPKLIRIMRAAANEHPNVVFVDVKQVLSDVTADTSSTVSSVDHFHLNDTGQDYWAQAVWRVLQDSPTWRNARGRDDSGASITGASTATLPASTPSSASDSASR